MTAIVITTTATTPEALIAELTAGTAEIHKQRETGTFRKVHYLAEGTEAREEAEWVLAQRQGTVEGGNGPRSMASIANEMHISVSALRRIINDLLLTHEVEGWEAEELADILNGAEEDMVMVEDNSDEN